MYIYNAAQGLDQLPRRRQTVTTLRRSMFTCDLHRRGHAGRAGGSAPNITAFHFRESVALVSGQCRVPQWPGTTKLSRSFGGQRGHVGRPVFLIELRCALWASPPSITAFGLPALSCQSVRAALLRPAQVPGSYIASASQVLVSALWRRYGLGSLAHRAGSAVAYGSAWPPVSWQL